jgi:hypothetical protein
MAAYRMGATSPEAASSASKVPSGLRIAGLLLRATFLIAVLMVTVRVSLPQNETIWTAYETPADLFRMALGFTVCVWIAVQLFRVPKDAQAYRTWTYMGLAAAPFAVTCALAVWHVLPGVG